MKILKSAALADNIKRLRASCDLTQEETVAQLQLLGSPLSRSTYSLIELGRANIFASDLVALQKIFKVDYSEFFENIPTSR